MFFALLLLTSSADQDVGCTPPKYEVVACLATECPLAKLYAVRLRELAGQFPQIRFRGISANEQDSEAQLAAFGEQLGFDFRRDPHSIHELGATRSPEVFFLINDRVVYQGRIDDQYTPGTNRSQPTRHDLAEAIRETLSYRPISVPRTTATGCRISGWQQAASATGEITYEHVAPILHRHCAGCHRPGEVAPFSLLTYQDAVSWQAMIGEVVGNNRMPPWHADPAHGTFANDRSLPAAEKSLLLRWLAAGAPRGNIEPAPPTHQTGWSIPTDLILEVQQPFDVPAHGVLDYQEFVLDPGLQTDTWIQAVEIQPGNRAVVHHINVYVRPKNAVKGFHYTNEMSDGYLAMSVPGNSVTSWPIGIAKRIPAGTQIVLSVHYQPNGTPQQDRSRIAFQFADPGTVRQQAATRVFLKPDLVIPPNSLTTAEQSWTLEEDFTLYALYPHMHLRGRSMRFEADGQVLLNVPNFDFNWQHRYVLAQPMPLKAGTVVRCSAVFDNTPANPNNPDSTAMVKHGEQSTDEMFQACFEIVRTHENRQSNGPPLSSTTPFAAVSLIGLLVRRMRKQPRDQETQTAL